MRTKGYAPGKDGTFGKDLKFGHRGEATVERIMEGQDYECKTERNIWSYTGNMAIEVEYNGKPSGIMTTDSEWWWQWFTVDEKVRFGWIFKTEFLREICSSLMGCGEFKYGGDNKKSKLLILNMNKVLEYASF